MLRSIWTLGFLLFYGCVTFSLPKVDVVMMENVQWRPEKNAVVSLSVPENREYVTIAIIEGEGKSTGHSYSDVVNEMKKKAGELGADMLVLSQPTPVAAKNVFGIYSDYKHSVNVKGVAISFVQSDSTKSSGRIR